MSLNENESTVIRAGVYFRLGNAVYYCDHITFSGAHCILLSGRPATIKTRKVNGQPQLSKDVYRHSRHHVVFAASMLVETVDPGKLDTRLLGRRIRMAKKENEGAGNGAVSEAPAAQAAKTRTTQIYALTEKTPKDTMKGQGKLVFDVLKGMGGKANVADLTDKVKATGQLQTRQDAERVVGFYLSKFKRDGLAKVEKVEEPVAAAV